MTPRDSVYSALRHLLRRSSGLRPGTAVDKLMAKSGLSLLRLVEGLQTLKREGLITGVTDRGDVVGMLCWTTPLEEPADSFLIRWKQRIERLPADRKEVICVPPQAARGLDDSDVVALTSCLADMDCSTLPGEDRYVLSANAVMGSSKVLDAFPALLGDQERQRTLFMVTAGPAQPRSVLFIENPSVFASLMRGDFIEENLIICAFGYGLTLENLPQRLRDKSVVPCTAAGVPVASLADVIADTPCFHWGDLDFEGLRIYEALRAAIPHLRLPQIYMAMVNRLRDPRRSHPYQRLFGKEGQRPPRGDDTIVARLAQACATRALDQEAMCPVTDLSMLVTAME